MPPQRTTPAQRTAPPKPSSKPAKTERTHEENQERAYIAASRRSDRSLEARIESARRASEIHKRRTGRALRVTEADVINEEMYEEEDDDHPYRNLNMMINPQVPGRIAAYYQHQLHMKNVVNRALQDQGARLNINGYASSQMYPEGYLQQQQVYLQQQQQQQQLQQQQYHIYTQTPQMQPAYRQQPYLIPTGGYSHGRAMSMHIPQNRSAMMAQSTGIPSQTQSPSPNTPISPDTDGRLRTNFHMRHISAPSPSHSGSKNTFTGGQSGLAYQKSPQVHQLPSPESDAENPYSSIFPLSNELPPESARFLAGQLSRVNSLNVAPYSNYDLFDNTAYTTSKGFTTSLSPSQQNDPFEPKTEDGLATTTGEMKWQPSKRDSPFPNINPLSNLLTGMPEDDILNTLFSDAQLLPPPTSSDGFNMLGDPISYDTLTGETQAFDQENWDKYMNQDWLDAGAA